MGVKKKIKVNVGENNADTGHNEDAPHMDEAQQAQHAADDKKPEELGIDGAPSGVSESESAEEISLSPEEAARLVKEKEEQYDRLLRTQADFDNYRKRVQKEQANLLKYGAENALIAILPVVDNIERAVISARAHENSNSQLREGVELVLAQFQDILKKIGVTPIETVGHKFDPNKHDALLRVHAPDVSEGTVVEEVRRGYYLHDKVLRPAQVTVATRESA